MFQLNLKRLALVGIVATATLGLAGCGAEDNLEVELDDGIIQGQMSGDARFFVKIPYAKPPVGDLRWKAPEPNDPWAPAIRNEQDFSDSCPQLADQGAPASNNEDCLYLNVWAPDIDGDAADLKAPVMVWIHGGGNFSGGAGIPIPMVSNDLWYDGQYFAANQGVVMVSLNYRLGPLGFYAHPDLAEENQPTGNQGLLDQRMALAWIQKNIGKFGGDPDNVTIFGESAGAANVCYHMASPGSHGLFHRAISQSGGCTIRVSGKEATIQDVASSMTAYGEAVGCAAGANQLECMRNVSVDDLLANGNQPSPGDADTGFIEGDWSFGAVIDGADGFMPDTARAIFKRGDIARVPYLLGTNTDESTTLLWRGTSLESDAEYRTDLQARFGDSFEDVYAMYPPSEYEEDYDLARENVVTDSGLLCGTHDTARLAADAGLDVFMYNFNVPWALLPSVLKAAHAAEMSHVFGKPFSWPWPISKKSTTERSQAVADAMNTYWATFAKTGNPNGDNDPAIWPQFYSNDDRRLQLDSDWNVLENYRTDKCAFWREYHGVE